MGSETSTAPVTSDRLELSEILRNLRPTPADYLRAARAIETGVFKELQPIQIAILATFTADVLKPYLVTEAAARGFAAQVHVAPFNQLEQQVFDGGSPLYAGRPDVIVLATRLEEVTSALTTRILTLSLDAVEDELRQLEARMANLIEGLRCRTTATVFCFNYAPPQRLIAGVADSSLPLSQASLVQRANERLAAVCRRWADVHVFDYARLVQEVGVSRWYDPKLWYLGRIPFSAEAQRELGRRLARYVRASRGSACKCLVLDLDDTLWGGVLGEEGVQGIALGEEYPGRAYKEFQRALASLRDQGVLLAIASKNDESDVLEVLTRHPDMVLKRDNFVAVQIHWEDKAKSLKVIAETLNIGTDALAFFDNSPAERAWIRSQLPEVTVIEVPASPIDFVAALDTSGAFDQLTISAEDRQRAVLYQRDEGRRQLQAQVRSVEEFLQALEMTATIGRVTHETLPRVAQLVAKTNQFNLTTRRHTAAELQTMIESGAIALWLRASDRFGDHGLVGVAIALPISRAEQWTIETLLLSCRVIGRRMETALLGIVSRLVRQRGGTRLLGEYLPTAKNRPASSCYTDHGFEPTDGEGRWWRWDLSVKGEIPLPSCITVSLTDG